jgi:hypothetical protein
MDTEMHIEGVVEAAVEKFGHRRLVISLIGIAAITASLLATMDLYASKRKERLDVEASLLRAVYSSRDAASQSLGGLIVLSSADLLRLSDAIDAHLASPNRSDQALGRAERAAFVRLAPIVQALKETPSTVDLPTFARAALSADSAGQRRLSSEFNDKLRRASEYAKRSDRLSLGLFLVAIATALLALAGVTPPSRATAIAIGIATMSLLGSVALAVVVAA